MISSSMRRTSMISSSSDARFNEPVGLCRVVSLFTGLLRAMSSVIPWAVRGSSVIPSSLRSNCQLSSAVKLMGLVFQLRRVEHR